jgi:hypothetical protein
MTWHKKYNDLFTRNPGQNDAKAYGAKIIHSVVPGQGDRYFSVAGIHHLTGEENGGNHHVYLDVLDESGKRINGARLMVVNNGKAPYPVMIDKPDNEAGANVPMYWNDTLKIYVAGDLPSEEAAGFHIRHDDEEPGTTRGHHSFYVVFWERRVGSGPPPQTEPEEPEQPTEPEEPGPEPVDWLTHFDDRQRKQIAFSRLYARDFGHGATGHNDMLIIAKMAELLDGVE